MHGEEELAEGGGGPARHIKLTVSVRLQEHTCNIYQGIAPL